MRIVLRSQRTALYLQELDTWVEMPHQARNFPNPIRALGFCVMHQLEADIVPILDPGEAPSKNPAALAKDLSKDRVPNFFRWRFPSADR